MHLLVAPRKEGVASFRFAQKALSLLGYAVP